MSRDYIFTSESVTNGHPDKICDTISDAILDEAIKLDKKAHVACEVIVSENWLATAGEISGHLLNLLNLEQIARDTVKQIGYVDPKLGFDYKNFKYISAVKAQSSEINIGVDKQDSDEVGAGDQGMMFGFATNEGAAFGDCQYMPLPIFLAHKLTHRLYEVRTDNIAGLGDFILPDGKAQVSLHYSEGRPKSIAGLVLSTHHVEVKDFAELRRNLFDNVIVKILTDYKLDAKEILAERDKAALGSSSKVFINAIGQWTKGGPAADSGLTGRKIIVDTYGGSCPHGGGSFSGKDPSKVDRSAAYMARYMAKNMVASGQADECLVQLSYVIGQLHPASVYIQVRNGDTTKILSESELKPILQKYDLRPAGIIKQLDLLRPIYKKTACFGHFGRMEPEFSWEKVDI
jgi:S-adenosylmethionine synthetase